MATSDLKSFARRMRVIADLVGENSAKVVRRAAIAADQAVVLATPVDTGRARANWTVSFGRPQFRQTKQVDPGGGITIGAAINKIGGYTIGAGGIYITNSLPYIARLEDGYSRQAPGGMTKFAIQAATHELRKGGLLKGV